MSGVNPFPSSMSTLASLSNFCSFKEYFQVPTNYCSINVAKIWSTHLIFRTLLELRLEGHKQLVHWCVKKTVWSDNAWWAPVENDVNREGRKISGLDLEKSDAYGRTALMLAAMGNHPGMVTRTNVSFLSVFKMSQSIYLYLLKSLNFFQTWKVWVRFRQWSSTRTGLMAFL